MNTQNEITRLQTARNTIRTKLVDLGLATSTAKLDALATAVDSIENKGAVSAQLKEGESYTIPKGYHNGSGTVKGVSGGGNYELQTKSTTPTKSQQSITPDTGYYGLASVTVGAIPENFNDTSAVTAGAADVMANKIIVNAAGETVPGTMPNNGAVNQTLDTTKPSYTVPKGYHSGSGTVKIVTETKSATPAKNAQTITPTAGKVLSSVTVGAIPAPYFDVSGVTAVPAHVLEGDAFVDKDGVTQEGTMANNGTITKTIDGLSQTSAVIPAGYTTGGTVSLTTDIEEALAAI